MQEQVRNTIRHLYHLFWRNPWSRILGDKHVTERLYRKIMHKKIDWNNPIDLNEKIHWLKLYTDTSQWTLLADKYYVRSYVEGKHLKEILIPLYGKYDSAADIDFNELPTSFVLKTNHGSGEVVLVKDKSKIDENRVRKEMACYLKERYGLLEGEPHYRKIKPCIIAEEYLQMPESSISTSLIDYKIWCFDGKPAYIWACYNRTKAGCDVEVHDLNWGYHPEHSVFSSHYRNGGGHFTKTTLFREDAGNCTCVIRRLS